jgi:hypothetical protein
MNTTTKTKPPAKSPAQQRRDDMLTVIAAKHLSRETLETRNSDSLDFSDQAVWSIKAALQEAYELGAQAALAAAAGRR